MTAVRLPAAERRHQLLGVALDVFSRRGFHDTSMRDVAVAAGVTKPVLYQHFESKQELYLELLDDVRRRLIATISGAAGAPGASRTQLESGLSAYFGFVADERRAFALLFGGSSPADGDIRTAVRAAETSVAGAIARLLDDQLPVERRLEIAHVITGAAEGVVRGWSAAGRVEAPAALARRTATLLWEGLGAAVTDRTAADRERA